MLEGLLIGALIGVPCGLIILDWLHRRREALKEAKRMERRKRRKALDGVASLWRPLEKLKDP